ncbi:MAG: hypothetical protein MZV64_11185 [Ignavibacteriales bacterium]|nr:hypothetical protein [Ignavibacteriales bacterium]
MKKKGFDAGAVGEDALRRDLRPVPGPQDLPRGRLRPDGEGRPGSSPCRPPARSARRPKKRSTPGSSRRSAALDGMKIHNPARKAHVLMGLVMTALRGRVEGAAVVERVRAAAEGRC